MNYTTKVKQELAQIIANARHCRLAELGAIIAICGRISADEGVLSIVTENQLVVEKTEKLIKKIFPVDIIARINYDKRRAFKEKIIMVFTKAETGDILETVKGECREDGSIRISPLLYTMPCCKRAFLRGIFLSSGSLTDPEKDYHLEIPVSDEELSGKVAEILAGYDIELKTIIRKNQYVLYAKDSEKIVDFLNVAEAHVALMDLENVRILKDVRNDVNRRVNCDTANIRKAVKAAMKQCDDIRYIESTVGWNEIDDALVYTARLRMENPDASLTELMRLHEEKVSKSGINHRLSKISEIAEKLRNEAEKNVSE